MNLKYVKMKINYISVLALSAVLLVSSCKKELQNGAFENRGDYTDVAGSLKETADFPIGLAFGYDNASTNPLFLSTAKTHADIITFGNELKNSSVVKADGSYDFTTADAFLKLATDNGLQVFGHTLVWHSQQRASYYKSLIGGGSGAAGAPELIVNGGFETAATNGDVADGWQLLNGASQFSLGSGGNANGGSKSLQAVVPAGGANYNTQVITRTAIPVTAGKTYTFSYYIKGLAAQNIQYEIRRSDNTVDYKGGKPVTTSFSKISEEYVVPAGVTSIQIAFDLGGTANTIFIDDVSLKETNYVAPSSNLAVNGGFENAATNGDIADGWQALNGASQFSVESGANANSGSKALKAVVPAGGANYNTQIITRTPIPVTAGKTYTISYYIKATTAQNIQYEIRKSDNTVDYKGGKPVTTSYAKISEDYVVPTGVTTIQLAFDLGGTANTIYIDDVSIADASVVPPPSNAQLAPIVDAAMKKHIETVLTRYKGKINAWDVLNEPFADDGNLRNNTNTTAGNDIFVWQHYLGIDFAAKAFQYAKAVDPTSDFYMNDYNLESNAAKLAAFVKLANDLKAANAGITGVGTQMHMYINTPYSGIISMMKALAATGLKVRISELDIRINVPLNSPKKDYVPTAAELSAQATMYKFVVQTYMQIVPPAQRGGIAVWGVDDTTSWINTTTRVANKEFDYPLLFDKDFNKKPAFAGFLQGLKEGVK